MPAFHIRIERPAEIIPKLGKQELDWKKGRSAFELATAWMQANALPPPVTAILAQAPEWQAAELLECFFERETGLPGRGRRSQTDLLGIVRLEDGNGILAVEGKVDEPFGPRVADWLDGEPARQGDDLSEGNRERSRINRRQRLAQLCALLEVDHASVGNLFYQLFHRTGASIYEARRFGYKRAVVLVHSFAERPEPPSMPAGFDDFRDFTHRVGMPIFVPDSISSPKVCGGIEVRLAWLSDKVSA
ncbi:DUF6946 family protein [Reyranella sp.]|uniref:DUF6946 family protein n=1 Tax=Reyranella sp. TaxID=1929291 RepID=UPI003D0A0F14